MRAIELQAHGFEGLHQVEIPQPSPGSGEILIKLRAASVNFRDLAVVTGRHRGKLPVIPLSDGVGTVIETAPDARAFKLGQRVCPIFAPGWASGPPCETSTQRSLGGDTDGVLREYMVLKAEDAVLVPEHLSDEEAASLPCAGVTAWSAVVEFGRVRPGDVVLIEGTGGVSLFALQFAKAAGARVALVSSSDEKLARAKKLGADILVNYKAEPEWGAAIRKLTDGKGVDLVVEVGGASTLAQALTALKFGGRVAQIGLLTGLAAALPLQHFVPKAAKIRGILTGSRSAFEAMTRAVALHELRPVIDRVVAFEDAGDAIAAMGKSSHFGKITIRISG
jgi:NADPH:quinone reductase-like Zn-dependent oxidoreductase